MNARWIVASAVVLLTATAVSPSAAPAQERATYTLTQAAAGRAAYSQSCAECHRDEC